MGKSTAPAAKPKPGKNALFAEPVTPFPGRWYGKLCLLLASTVLLTLSFAPINQFYLAWIGLAPWLVAIAHCRSYKAAVLWGWLGGTLFFVANMWWMAYVTGPGMVGLMALMGLYWGVMAAVVHVGFREPGLSFRPQILLVAFAWVALEFIRGNFVWRGLPWLYLGHTQTSLLPIVQIADVLGVYGVSFWVVLINVVVASWWLAEKQFRVIKPAVIYGGILTAVLLGYGLLRIYSTATVAGPTVVVIQSNYPQSNTGEKGASAEEAFIFHHDMTRKALKENPKTDLVVWSETMMPPINAESRQSLETLGDQGRSGTYGHIHMQISRIANETGAGIVTGILHVGEWTNVDGYAHPEQKRNAAIFYERDGKLSDLRYDKIHIVPFGEFIPFKESIPWLYRIMVSLGPPDMDAYQLIPGAYDALTVFPLRKTPSNFDLETWRLGPSICFEDIDSGLTARMFRPVEGGGKRADVLINLTNDGWFRANEMPQHLQVARFRSIENRVPTARSVNTGISAFIDSVGRVNKEVPVGTEGYAVMQLQVDPRLTFYTRFGDVFAWICIGLAVSMILLQAVGRKNTV